MINILIGGNIGEFFPRFRRGINKLLLDQKFDKNQGCVAFVVPPTRWCNGVSPRPPAPMVHPMAGFSLPYCLLRRGEASTIQTRTA